jgi:hypothetical protein
MFEAARTVVGVAARQRQARCMARQETDTRQAERRGAGSLAGQDRHRVIWVRRARRSRRWALLRLEQITERPPRCFGNHRSSSVALIQVVWDDRNSIHKMPDEMFVPTQLSGQLHRRRMRRTTTTMIFYSRSDRRNTAASSPRSSASTSAEPTITPSTHVARRATCSRVRMPKPAHTGTGEIFFTRAK